MPRKSRKADENPITGKLTEVFANGDDKAFREILKNLACAYGTSRLGRDSGFNRISMWRYFRGEQDIKLSDFISILKVLGIKVRFDSESKLEMMLQFFEWRHRDKSLNSESEATVTAQAVREG